VPEQTFLTGNDIDEREETKPRAPEKDEAEAVNVTVTPAPVGAGAGVSK